MSVGVRCLTAQHQRGGGGGDRKAAWQAFQAVPSFFSSTGSCCSAYILVYFALNRCGSERTLV